MQMIIPFLSLFLSAQPVGEPIELAPEPRIEAAAVAFPELTDEELFDRATTALENLDTLRARFEQYSPSGRAYAGVISLDRPGRLRFEYDDPNPQLIVATGGLVYVHDADLETTDSYPVSETPLRFLLDERLDRDVADVKAVTRAADAVTFYLESRDSDVRGELALTFSAPEMTLAEWAVREPSGEITTVLLTDIETGIRLPGRLFRAPDSGGTFLRDR
jgi:outer membrane lipoprotein-sorting protein